MDKVIYRKKIRVDIDRGGWNTVTPTIDSHAKDPDAVAFIRRDVVLLAISKAVDFGLSNWDNPDAMIPDANKILDAELGDSN